MLQAKKAFGIQFDFLDETTMIKLMREILEYFHFQDQSKYSDEKIKKWLKKTYRIRYKRH